MLLSNSAEYAVRASVLLATLEPRRYHSIRDISDELEISFHFLTKVFQKLTVAGLLESLRGPKGGVRLARRAGDIRVIDVVRAIDGDQLFRECVLGLPGCGDERPCPLHDRWAPERERLFEMFSETTVGALAGDRERYDLRLKTS